MVGRILDVLSRSHESMALAELVGDSGFARSTVIIHLERLGSAGLVLKEKKPSKGRGRPEFLYHPAETAHSKIALQPSIVMLEFSKLKRACRYAKGGYCKPQGTLAPPRTAPNHEAEIKSVKI